MHFWQLMNISFIRTLYAFVQAKGLVICYKKSYFHIKKGARLELSRNSIMHLNRSHYPSGYHNAGLLYLKEHSLMKISGRVSFGDGMKITLHSGSICSFNNCTINNHCDIGIKSKLYVGEGSLIGDYCSIHDFDGHKILNKDGKFVEGIAEIHIGKNVWIGEHVTILKGVHIGDNAIIGAGTLVTKNVPEGTLVVGNPCSILRENVSWKE